jgi:hypothetical protein
VLEFSLLSKHLMTDAMVVNRTNAGEQEEGSACVFMSDLVHTKDKGGNATTCEETKAKSAEDKPCACGCETDS